MLGLLVYLLHGHAPQILHGHAPQILHGHAPQILLIPNSPVVLQQEQPMIGLRRHLIPHRIRIQIQMHMNAKSAEE